MEVQTLAYAPLKREPLIQAYLLNRAGQDSSRGALEIQPRRCAYWVETGVEPRVGTPLAVGLLNHLIRPQQQ